MNKRTIKLGIIFVGVLIVLASLIGLFKNIKVDEFTPASVIFVLDSSASNQSKLEEQKLFVKQLCSRLDPEDSIKIIRVSEDAYLIYEGSAQHSAAITKSMNAFTKYDNKDWGTAYGVGLEKAFSYANIMTKEGYKSAVVVVGDLENEGAVEKQINWTQLPNQVLAVQKQNPDFAMMFVFAHPQKLDLVKSTLAPVLGETKLVISTEETVDKSINKFLTSISR